MPHDEQIPTTRSEALEVLARHGYTPGRSRTVGMPEPVRRAIKAACRILARTPAPPAPAPAPAEDC